MDYNNFILPYYELTSVFVVILFIGFFSLKNISSEIGMENISSGISIETSNFLKGFFILTVVVHHLSQRVIEPGFLKIYQSLGYLSVGVFFTLSGYGLSASKKPIKNLFFFAKNKLIRVYLPCFSINLLLFFVMNVKIDILYVLFPTSMDNTQWFITTILIFYFFYYISSLYNNNIQLIIVCVTLYFIACYVMQLGSWWYISSFCFPLGFIWHKYHHYITSTLSKKYLVVVMITSFVFIIFSLAKKYISIASVSDVAGAISCTAFSILILSLVVRYQPKSKFISNVGVCSLELYVLHMKLMWVLYHYSYSYNFLQNFWFMLYFVVLLLFGYAFFKLNNVLIKFVK